MTIELRHMARVELPPDEGLKALILGMFCYKSRTGETFYNYSYKDGVAYLPPSIPKLEVIASLLGTEIVDQRSKGSPLGDPFLMQPSFKFRDYQLYPAETLVKHIKKYNYGVLQAPCGAGKSTVVSYAAGCLGVPIIVIVDQGNLVQSWQEAMHNIWGKELNLIKATSKAVSDCSIATFQLLHKNPDLLNSMMSRFGCSVVDEAHVIKAATFKGVLSRLNTKYRIGTSATFYSKNLPIDILEDFISSVSVTMKNNNSLVPLVEFVTTQVSFCSEDPMDFASRITPTLAKDMRRMSVVFDLMRRCISDKRRTIVICITSAQAHMIQMFSTKLGATSEVYIGATSAKRDAEVKKKFEEGAIDFLICNKKLDKGYDVPSADAIILSRPSNNMKEVTQVTGRVVRSLAGKRQPLIFDLVDLGTLAERFKNNRTKWYKELGYHIATC